MNEAEFDREAFDRFGRFLGWYMQSVFLPGFVGAVVLGFVSRIVAGNATMQRLLERVAFDGGGLLVASWLGLVGVGCLWLTLRRAQAFFREPGWMDGARTLLLALCGLGLVLLSAGFARASGRGIWSLLV